jgi:general transcription factor IIIA
MPYPCTKIDPITNKPCTEGFKQGTQLRVHVLRYHSGIRFWCHECKVPASGDEGEIAEPRELGFHTYELFERHKRLVHPPNCALCPKVCSTQSELRRHIEAQHSDTKTEKPRAYRCQATGCCREFTKRSNLKVHIRSVHDHIRSFVCGKTDLISSKITEGWDGQGACGKDFAAKRALEEHVRIQHMGLDACRNRNVRGNKKGRDVSGETVKGSSMIARLTGIGYEENRHIPCLYPSCSSRFFRQYDLEIHMKAKHCLSGGEIIELFVEKEALSGGRFWFGADVQDEEYWDWDLEDTAAFDRERAAEGDAEMTQRADRDKCHILDSDSQEMVGEGTVTAFQVMHDRPMEDRGAEFGDYEMFIDPVLRSL